MVKTMQGTEVRPPKPLTVEIPVAEFRSLPIPGIKGASIGTCYVRVTDLPRELDQWMGVNPRVPNRTGTGRLSGPVPKAILTTLTDQPSDFALKNIGIYLLVASADHRREGRGEGTLTISLRDPKHQGMVNGGHTFAAICQAVDEYDCEDETQSDPANAFVRLHILQGVSDDRVVEIAEGLNRSKQVQNPSLQNLEGNFEFIKKRMQGVRGENQIAYYEGATGDVYIGEILAFIEMFNMDRYPENKIPSDLYGRQYKAVNEFQADLEDNRPALEMVVEELPEILRISDLLRRDTKSAAEELGFKLGRANDADSRPDSLGRRRRMASEQHRATPLHFIGGNADYRLPTAWLYPMLAAFRQNVVWDRKNKKMSWKRPNDEVFRMCLADLVQVCIQEHKGNSNKPEWVGKKESSYRQCALYVELHLARKAAAR